MPINERLFISRLLQRLKTWTLPVLVTILAALNVSVLSHYADTSDMLQDTRAQAVEVKQSQRATSKKLEQVELQKIDVESSLRETRLENESLKVNLQAKKEAERIAAENAVLTAPVRTASAPQGNATCVNWLAQAGISDMVSAVELQRRENGSCDPQLYNRGGSDACGVAQELPCGKSGCGVPPKADGFCQIQWMNRYVLGRYGSWAAALQHHNIKNWY